MLLHKNHKFIYDNRAVEIRDEARNPRAAACLGKLLTSAKTRFRLRNVVARQRAFFDGAPLKFSRPATFHARRGATTCHFFAIFRKNHHFFSKNKVFYAQKDRTRVLSFLYFLFK